MMTTQVCLLVNFFFSFCLLDKKRNLLKILKSPPRTTITDLLSKPLERNSPRPESSIARVPIDEGHRFTPASLGKFFYLFEQSYKSDVGF